MFNKNPRFVGLKFPDISKPETLDRRYVGKFPQDAMKLMKGMLTLDPKQRWTAIECLASPWFDNLRDKETERLIAIHQ